MIINHNLAANNAIRNMNINTSNASKSMQKLSSGLRINSAADDAAGLAISEKMRGQIRGLDQASSNAQDATSLIQTAEGGLNETTSILQRMRELAVQSSTDTNTADDRAKIQSEVDQLAKEITRISNTTEFNTQNLLAGNLNDTFQIGANAGQNIKLSVNAMDAKSLGVASDVGSVTGSTAGGGLTTSAVQTADLGRGLAAATYSINITHTGASSTSIGKTTAGALTLGGTFTGQTTETNVQFKVTSVSASGTVTGAQYSTDGGNSWAAASVGATDSTITYKGATVLIGVNAGNAVGNTATVTFTAAHDDLQLKTSGGSTIGSAVTVYANQTSATIGDSTTGKTMTVHSTSFGSLTTSTAASVTVAMNQSTVATFNSDGTINTEANAEAGIDVSTQSAANTAITTINKAINTVSQERAKLGAYSNRLEHTIANLGTSSENLTSSESRIRDVDMAKEMSEYSKNNILSQAAQAMLAQANQQPQQVLQLLR